MSVTIQACSAEEFIETVHAAGAAIPVEQSPAWARYDDALPGREHWRYLVANDGDRPIAALSLTVFTGRFLEQVWAKNGPIWLGIEQTRSAEAERDLRDALTAYLKQERPSATVLRLHAVHQAPDLIDPLIGVYWDRTVMLDLTKSGDELLADASQSGRRYIRKATRNPDLTFNDETDISAEEFARTMYPIFVETGERGGFVLRPANFYYELLHQLGPDVCRLFTVRHRGEVVSWMIGTVYDGRANYYYAASTDTARKLYSAYLMVWSSVKWAKEQGATSYDFLGCGSERVPNLSGLNQFKTAFNRNGIVDVPGPWDVVLRPAVLRVYHAHRQVIAHMGSARATAGGIVRRARARPPRPRSALLSKKAE